MVTVSVIFFVSIRSSVLWGIKRIASRTLCKLAWQMTGILESVFIILRPPPCSTRWSRQLFSMSSTRKPLSISLDEDVTSLAYELDAIYSNYFPLSPRPPLEQPTEETTTSNERQIHLDSVFLARNPSTSSRDSGSLLLRRRLKAQYSAYRDSPVLRRTPRSLSFFNVNPRKKTYIWDPMSSEWTILEKDAPEEPLPLDGKADQDQQGMSGSSLTVSIQR
ncbi:hypothetical protein M422DRAFT_46124 [Sphaerobolus stellatus SS14]|nr:hypothetical protein M422DRAFT_46124 [Sphaerobolus stellatus SS14]